MSSNHNITAEELWRTITTLKTTQEWMELTNGFSLYTIYHHSRILQDPEKIETYQCMIRKEYPKSLEKFDEKDPLVVCYMMMGNGNLRRSSNPSFFDRLLDEGVRSAHNDGPYLNEETEEPDTPTDNTPAVVKIAAIIELLDKMKITRASYDTTKFIAMIAFFTACSEKYVSRKLYEGFTLTERHKPHIDRINQLFSDFNLPISLKVGTSY